ncbi:MAG: MFS transporter [Candidatus Aureabacteria bacterium]|nr:MFS transporter [Candidatus Auribacterota bacterium]
MILRSRFLYVYAFIMNSSTGVMVVSIPLLAIRFGAGPLMLGLLGSVGSLVYTLACPFAGRVSDAHALRDALRSVNGRRRSMMLSCALLICVDLCILFASGIRDLLIMAACASLCSAFFWPALQAWLAEAPGEGSLSDRLGLFNLSWSVGIMIGPVIGGCLFAANYRFPWYYGIAASSCMLASLLVLRDSPPRSADPLPAQEPATPHRRHGIFLPLSLWANFVCWFCLANVQSLYPKYAVTVGFSPQMIGFFLFLVGAAQSLFFIMLRSRPAWQFRYGPLIVAHAAAGGGMLVLSHVVSLPFIAVSFLPLGCALGLSYYSSIYYSLCGRGETGRRAGIHERMVGSGFFVGPITGGVIARYLDMRSPFILCGLLLLATSVGEAILRARSRRRKE